MFFKTHLDSAATVVCHKNITVTREASGGKQKAGSDMIMTFWRGALRTLATFIKIIFMFL